MNDVRPSRGREEGYRYAPPRVFGPGQVPQRGFEECQEERPRRPGESIMAWLDAVHEAMLELPGGEKKRSRRQKGSTGRSAFEDRDIMLNERDLARYEENLLAEVA